MPDINKPLDYLNAEWNGCMRCPLGQKREEAGNRMVFGRGYPGGIMFVGEGPGKNEAEAGLPFIGASGKVLQNTIDRLKLTEVSYISNVIACRSFGIRLDTQGQPMYRKDRKSGHYLPVLQDEAPTAVSVNACLARLYEEIYLVDPILIVALGGEAAKALTRRSVSVTSQRGTSVEVNVPGAWHVATRTSKGNWARRVHGQVTYPTEQNYVRYLMYITLHPAHVLYKQADQSHGNPAQVFIQDMHAVADIYYRYRRINFGIDNVRDVELTPNDIIPPDEA